MLTCLDKLEPLTYKKIVQNKMKYLNSYQNSWRKQVKEWKNKRGFSCLGFWENC